ncbi:response regulator [Aggregatilineales bacterium SYSU G02658]
MSTWMVVEDEANVFELLLAMFEMWGIAGRAFIDGEEAIAWLEDVDSGRFKGELPELVLLDLRLPGDVQGEQVGARLRQSEKLKHVPIVIITAYTYTAERRAEIEKMVQPDLWLSKPLPKFNQLQSLLEETIAKKRESLPPEKLIKPLIDPLEQITLRRRRRRSSDN